MGPNAAGVTVGVMVGVGVFVDVEVGEGVRVDVGGIGVRVAVACTTGTGDSATGRPPPNGNWQELATIPRSRTIIAPLLFEALNIESSKNFVENDMRQFIIKEHL